MTELNVGFIISGKGHVTHPTTRSTNTHKHLLRSDPQLTDLPDGLLSSLPALNVDIVPNLDRAGGNVVLLIVGVA